MIIIDRFEGDTAVIEIDGTAADVPRDKLPSEAKEGDVLILNNGEYVIDASATFERRRAVRKKLHRLLKREND